MKTPNKPMMRGKDMLKPLGQTLSLGEAVLGFPQAFGKAVSGKTKMATPMKMEWKKK